MAIEIVPKAEIKPVPWQNLLLYFFIFLFLVSVISYLALDYYFIKKAEQKLQELEMKIAEAKTPQQIALEEEILDYREKIEDFSSLLLNHKKNSNFFNSFEKIIHPRIFFSELDLNTKLNQVKLSGRAESFRVLGEQLLIFREAEFIENLSLSNLGIGEEGEIKFTFNLQFDPNLFK